MDCLLALQTDEPCKGDEGALWNLCTWAHSNLAMPLTCAHHWSMDVSSALFNAEPNVYLHNW